MKTVILMKDLRVIFMGTPDFAVPVLESLIKNTNVIMVVSQPNKQVGRHKILTDTPVAATAKKYNIPIFQPVKIRNDYEEIIKANPDIIITCAYGQIIPKILLDTPRLGCINVHASLLPYLRGGAPLHHAIIDGYQKTGVTIMYMDEKMDTGDIISTVEYQIKSSDTVGDIHDNLMTLAPKLLIETLPSIIEGTNNRQKQDNTIATYAYNITREDEHLDFTKSGVELERQVRGLNPWPLANFKLNGEEIKVLAGYFVKGNSKIKQIEVTKNTLAIGCQDGWYYITELKPSGKKAMPVKAYLNGVSKDQIIKMQVE